MKKRILSVVCAVAIIATMLTVGIVSSFAAGTALATPIDKAFEVSDWDFVASSNLASGQSSSTSTASITSDGKFASGYGSTITIVSKTPYDLSNGFVSKSTLNFKNHFNNHYGEYCAMYIGDVATGLELRIQNVKNQSIYNAYIYYGGDIKASYNLGSAPNGEYIVKYQNGKVTVSKGGDLINWVLPTSTSTEVEIASADFGEAKMAYRISGNYSGASFRYWKGVYLEALTGDGGSSSTPESSESASSESASSESVSSAPASSESASSTTSSEVTSSETVSAAPASPADISNIFAADWEGDVECITAMSDGVRNLFGNIAPNTSGKKTITTVNAYNLGNNWTAAVTLGESWGGNTDSNPYVLTVGTLDIIVYDVAKNNAAPAAIELKKDGTSVRKVELAATIGTNKTESIAGKLEVDYKDGTVSVSYKGTKYITEDVGEIDFTNAKAALSITGNWIAKSVYLYDFNLKTVAEDVSSSAPAKGEPIVTVIDGTLNATDWEGDIASISADGKFHVNNGAKTINTVNSYDLSDGFKFKSNLVMKNHYSNYYGEYCSMYVGGQTGLELRIQQDKEGRGSNAFYNGYLLYNGVEIASADLLNAPNGEYEIIYKDGKVTVNLQQAPITWTLADKTTATSVSIADADFSNAKLGLRIAGNYASPESLRNWNSYSLSAVSDGSNGAGSVGGTGDARNIVIPAVAIVLGACAVAFVAKSRKINA